MKYVLSDSRNKELLIVQIYDQISQLNPPGRFLEKTQEGTLNIKSKNSSLKKIKKALSENNAAIIEYLKRRGKWKEETLGRVKLKPDKSNLPIARR